jgi:hypothetical protein
LSSNPQIEHNAGSDLKILGGDSLLRNQLVNHIKHHELDQNNTIYVVGVCSNPARWHSRYNIARQWIKHMLGTANVHLTIVEGRFGDRGFELTLEDWVEELKEHFGFCPHYDHIKVQLKSEAWVKESLMNIGFRSVIAKYNAKYLGCIDMDVFFRDENWAQEAMHQLQTFQIIQPWQDCADLGPHGGISRAFRSFGYQHQRGVPKQTHPSQPYEYAHTGFAWCFTTAFYHQVMGLMDFPILGSADHHMAFACIGRVNDTIHAGMQPDFFELCREWQERALQITNGEVGFSVGRIEHVFHGPKNRRYYRERWQILVDNKFSPKKDLRRDEQGVVVLVGKPKLEHAIIKYNRARLEDSIEEF